MNPFSSVAADASSLPKTLASNLTGASDWNDDTRRAFDEQFTNSIALQTDVINKQTAEIAELASKVLRLIEE